MMTSPVRGRFRPMTMFQVFRFWSGKRRLLKGMAPSSVQPSASTLPSERNTVSQLSSMLSLPPPSVRIPSNWTPMGLRRKEKARRFSLKVSMNRNTQSSSMHPSRLVTEQRSFPIWESRQRKAK